MAGPAAAGRRLPAETKLADEAFTALLGDELAQRGCDRAPWRAGMEIIVEAYGAKHIEY